mmetsp:Transcript_8958/g.13397  ORF Transcript_8958/g.13397 Transcript_8958/m.13397 type:complete len:202 (+) Transcript_8958:44-649(+)
MTYNIHSGRQRLSLYKVEPKHLYAQYVNGSTGHPPGPSSPTLGNFLYQLGKVVIFAFLSRIFEVFRHFWHFIIIFFSCSFSFSAFSGRVRGINLLKMLETVRTELANDPWKKFLKLLTFSVSTHDVSVSSDRGLNLWRGEVNHGSVLLEKVNFFNGRNVTYVQSLQRVCQPFIIVRKVFSSRFLLPSHRAFPARSHRILVR